jgi:hypothetical protein
LNAPRIAELIDCYLDAAITEAEQTELETLLQSDAEARTAFWRATQFHAQLREFGEGRNGFAIASQAELPATDEVRSPRSTRGRWALPIVLACVAGLTATWFIDQQLARQPDGPEVARSDGDRPREVHDTTDAVAVFAESLGVRWKSGSARPLVGSLLAPGRWQLNEGWIWLELNGGATVVVEGPADIELVDASTVVCHAGRLTAEVPAAVQGFRLRAAEWGQVSEGTSLGTFVASDGSAEWHVFSGQVTLEDAAQQTIESREAVSTAAVSEQPRRSQSSDFMQVGELVQQVSGHVESRFQAWLDAISDWQADPSLVALYTFQPISSYDRRLANQAPMAALDSHGTLVGCQWTEGRWPGKHALDFKRPTDRVRLTIPGEYDSVSLMTWVRVDALPNPFNSLLLTDGFHRGELHWQIRDSGFVQLGIAGDKAFNHDTAPLFSPEWFGRWVHLGIVCDSHNQTVTHWFNGEPVASVPLGTQPPFRFGSAELGNWQSEGYRTSPQTIRNFNGRMDELIIIGRAITAGEVRNYYEASRPDAPIRLAGDVGL